MARGFDEEEFQRLLESGDLPEIPRADPAADAKGETQVVMATGDQPLQIKDDGGFQGEQVRRIADRMDEIAANMQRTYDLLRRVMEG